MPIETGHFTPGVRQEIWNQNTAGAYRTYATSLRSFGFTAPAPELGADGLLPFTLTKLGETLASAFSKRLDPDFEHFVRTDVLRDRDSLRSWGQQMCFSTAGRWKTYRGVFLKGFLLGDVEDAEARYRTVSRLFGRRLLNADYSDDEAILEAAGEEEADAMEELSASRGLGNDRVLLHFYEEPPRPDNRDFQSAAVYELLSLGLSAIFELLVSELGKGAPVRVSELATAIAATAEVKEYWKQPLGALGPELPEARSLVHEALAAESSLACAGYGGALLARVIRDRAFTATAEELCGPTERAQPIVALIESVLVRNPERSLASLFSELVTALVERHELVSILKGKQRWWLLEEDRLIKDDLQEMRAAFHSLRFPQLYSLCRDVALQPEDLCERG